MPEIAALLWASELRTRLYSGHGYLSNRQMVSNSEHPLNSRQKVSAIQILILLGTGSLNWGLSNYWTIKSLVFRVHLCAKNQIYKNNEQGINRTRKDSEF